MIFTTDADCVVSPEWLSTMASYFDHDVNAVASWLLIDKAETCFQKVEALDSFSFVLVGAAAIGLNRPVLANGANFAYRRSEFLKNEGFAGHDAYGSGDDDLLLQKFTKRAAKCVFVKDSRAAVYTPANTRKRDFFRQRLRWASKTRVYRLPLQIMEIVVYGLICMLVAGPFLWMGGLLSWLSCLALLSVKFAADYWFVDYGYRIIYKKVNICYFLVAQIVQNLYIPVVGLWGTLGQYEWKGRRYHKGKRR
ncbi:MAG: glycosyltransferase family 2 protein [candidate division KSB1 bacterium]|nr:glycosyltransferase family 2 protein [candidate division KSB1 bacterium]